MLPPPEKIDEYRETLLDLKNRIALPEKGWIKRYASSVANKIENLGELLEGATDGDPTTSMAEGMKLNL